MKIEDLQETIMKKTVVDWLNEISYKDDAKYIPNLFAIKFVNFIKLVNGEEGEENETPILHYRMLDAIDSPHQYLANLLFRGAAKTTVFAEYLFLYIATYGELPHLGNVNLAIYVSDSIENGVKNLRKNLEFRWEESAFLQKYVPKAKFTDIRYEFENAAGHKLIVKGYGAKTGVRGAKELGVRPQLAVLDDLVSDEDARSATVIASIEDTVSKAVDYALHPQRRKVIWNGTPFNQNDPLYKAIESGGWNVNVFPVCEKFPCTREEFVGAWPDRFNYDFVRSQYNKKLLEGKIADFNQELMLRIISDEEKLIKDHDVGWYSRDKLLRNRHSFNWYLTTDFAVSEQQRADDTGQSVWAVNHNRDIFWVDGVLEKLTMDKNFDKLFDLVQRYNPISTGIEVDGQQKGFISLLQRAMMDRQIFFNLASDKKSGEPGIRSKGRGQKFVRFNTYAVPLFKAHKIWLPIEMKDTPIVQEIINQISLVTAGGFKSKKDDWLDTCSQLQELEIYAPSAESTNPTIEDDIWGRDEASEYDNLDSYIY